jgi:hypothetical protein
MCPKAACRSRKACRHEIRVGKSSFWLKTNESRIIKLRDRQPLRRFLTGKDLYLDPHRSLCFERCPQGLKPLSFRGTNQVAAFYEAT